MSLLEILNVNISLISIITLLTFLTRKKIIASKKLFVMVLILLDFLIQKYLRIYENLTKSRQTKNQEILLASGVGRI